MDLVFNGLIILIGFLILGVISTAFGADSRESFGDDWGRTGRR